MTRIAGIPNFRHLPHVRPGTLWRSEHLGLLDERDVDAIRTLGISRVLDFRGLREREDAVCAVDGVTVHALAIEPTVVQKMSHWVDSGRMPTAAETVAVMQETYRNFVRAGAPRFAEFFSHLLESNEPTVFHCTAGKDRTGFAAALVLRALGVHEDDVMDDYLRTNDLYVPRGLGLSRLPPHVAHVLARVQPEFLQAADAEVLRLHGSFDAFMRDAIGVGDEERDRLRALYSA